MRFDPNDPEGNLAKIGAKVVRFEPGGDGPVAEPLELISAASFATKTTPHRQFLVADMIPARNVTILSGDGGTGKSLVAMQLAVSVSMAALWLGMKPQSGSVLYFSAEDDADETHIRLNDICEADGLDLSLMTRLHIAVMAGQDCLLATESAKTVRMDQTPLFARLEASLTAERPVLLVLDNLADIFGGNENVKGLVRQFVGMLRGLAITHNCAILLLAHPSLSGMASGTGTSGNTAWNNSVRSRLYLKRQHDVMKEITDTDFRKLVTMKANYAPTGGEIGMRWECGRFIATDTPATAAGTIDRMAIASKAERVFLALLHQFNEVRRNVSPSSGANFAPLIFSKHFSAEGVTKRQFEIAMDTLFQAGRIEIEETGSNSRRRKNLVLKAPEGEK